MIFGGCGYLGRSFAVGGRGYLAREDIRVAEGSRIGSAPAYALRFASGREEEGESRVLI